MILADCSICDDSFSISEVLEKMKPMLTLLLVLLVLQDMEGAEPVIRSTSPGTFKEELKVIFHFTFFGFSTFYIFY